MPRMSPAAAAAHQAKHAHPARDGGAGRWGCAEEAKPGPAGREKHLHDQIQTDCNRRGWVTFHGATHKRAWRTKGEPDFSIAIPGGITLWVECKTRDGTLSPEQIDVEAKLRALDHRHFVVRDLAEWMAVARQFPNAATHRINS